MSIHSQKTRRTLLNCCQIQSLFLPQVDLTENILAIRKDRKNKTKQIPSMCVEHKTTQDRSWPVYARWPEHTQLQLTNSRFAWTEGDENAVCPGLKNYSYLHEKLGAGVGERGGEEASEATVSVSGRLALSRLGWETHS